uniref:Protein kinase domain-containing protein n=1 Tax=Meloidogyne javanica TaxID=6303 RepID=A0A915LY78_MELJA
MSLQYIEYSFRYLSLTKRVDVWAFGLMSYKLLYTLSVDKYEDLDKLLNEYRNDLTKISRLDRIIKACIQVNPFKRPSMKALNNFWNKECDAFNYEKENFKNSSSKEDNNEVTLKQMRIDLFPEFRVISAKPIKGRHNAIVLEDMIREILAEFTIPEDRIFIFVRDAAEVMVKYDL